MPPDEKPKPAAANAWTRAHEIQRNLARELKEAKDELALLTMGRGRFFAELDKVQAAADKLPKAEPGTIKDQGGYRFVGVRHAGARHPYTQWELLGPTGYATGVCFGYWDWP